MNDNSILSTLEFTTICKPFLEKSSTDVYKRQVIHNVYSEDSPNGKASGFDPDNGCSTRPFSANAHFHAHRK